MNPSDNKVFTGEQEEFKKPLLLLDTERLKPLPKELWDMPCSSCQRLEAKWAFMPSIDPKQSDGTATEGKDSAMGEPYTLCSLCFLYKSEWGKRRRTDIDAMVTAVEAEMTHQAMDQAARAGRMAPEKFASLKIVFAKDEEGRMTDNRDANRIVGAIALFSQQFLAKMDTAVALQDKIDAQRIVLPSDNQFSPKRQS